MKKDQILPLVAILMGLFCLVFSIWLNNKADNIQPIEIQPPQISQPEKPKLDVKPSSYAEVLAIAKQQGKHVFLFFEADWCKWCKKMEIETLAKPQAKKALSQYLIYYVNINKEKEIAAKYSFVRSVPAYVVINGEEQILKRGSGYRSEAAFIIWLNTRTGDAKLR